MSRTVRMSVHFATAALGLWLASMDAVSAQDSVKKYQIAEQSLSQALREFALASNLDLLFSPDLVAGKKSSSLDGKFTVDEGLRTLLRGSGLEFSVSGSRIVINEAKSTTARQANAPTTSATNATNGYTRLAQAETGSPQSSASSRVSAENSQASDQARIELEEIIVTGTNIRGVYPSSSPVEIYTAEDIAQTGAITMEQFIHKLPQNMATRSPYASGAVGTGDRINPNAVAGVDLRGLGVGTSLVLMNGRRLGLADFGRTADVSMIPVSAIEQVEVLTDGASAIYGSDAVGGVVNFVLRKDFDGAETRISYGGTRGNLRQGDFTQTFGRSWSSGHGLLSLSAYSASDLEVADRNYAALAERGNLTPVDQRQNVLATFSQDMGERFTISGDLVRSRRDVKSETSTVSSPNRLNWDLTTYNSETEQSFANLALDYDISATLHGAFKATFAETDVEQSRLREFYNRTPVPAPTLSHAQKDYSARDLTAILDGSLFAIPGGAARFSLGAGVFEEDYSGNISVSITSPIGSLGRRTSYAFGEVFLPFVSAGQNIPLVHRLELNLAARYTRYDDQSSPALTQEFGDGTDPKIGLLWAPTEALGLRATYGTSFRAPSMIQLAEDSASIQLFTSPVPSPSGPSSTVLLLANGPVPDIVPETATTRTLGFDFRWPDQPGFRVSGTYYNISYEDRLARAPTSNDDLVNPQLHATVVFQPTSAAYLENLIRAANQFFAFPTSIDPAANPAGAAQTLFALMPNVWMYDLRLRNLSLSEQDGFDLSVSNSTSTSWGQIRYGANFTRILSYLQQAARGEPLVTAVDVATLPVSFRSRAHVGFSRGGFDGTLSLNYVDDYVNDAASSQGAASIESWTTADLSLAYDVDEAASGLLEGVRLSLSVQNLFDQEPPFVASTTASGAALFNPVGFDPINANPLGRIVVFGVSKNW